MPDAINDQLAIFSPNSTIKIMIQQKNIGEGLSIFSATPNQEETNMQVQSTRNDRKGDTFG